MHRDYPLPPHRPLPRLNYVQTRHGARTLHRWRLDLVDQVDQRMNVAEFEFDMLRPLRMKRGRQ